MAISWLRTLFSMAEGALDLGVLLTNIKRIQEGITHTVESLPPDIKAKVKKKANYRVFAQAMDMLKIPERDAIDDILAALLVKDPTQAMQERFILQAVLTGPALEDTAVFLRGLATRSTDEAVTYLVTMDYTQEPETVGWVRTVLKKAPKAIAETAKEFFAEFKTAAEGLGVDFDATGLPAASQRVRDRAKQWADSKRR